MAEMKINRVIIIPYKPKEIHKIARMEAGKLWTDIVKLHKYIRKRSMTSPDKWKWSNESAFEKHFKGRYNLHSQTIQGIIQKFFANINTALKNRKAGDKKARLTYRYKKYFNVIFKGQAIKQMNNRIRLPLKNKKYIWINIPEINGKIVQAELGYNRVFLTIQRVISVPEHTSNKVAAIDFGIIHTAVITDGDNDLAIVGRGIRSIKQGHAKNLAKMSKKLSKTKKGSKRRKKLIRAKFKLIEKTENRIRNALHQVSRKLVSYCTENAISAVAYGDLAGINENKKKKRRKQCNQEIGMMEFGTLYKYLEYKLSENGIKIEKISERNTSKTCPVCGNEHKAQRRTYKCKDCGYVGIRDLVGAYNIRNLYINSIIQHGFSVPPLHLKYLRPIKLIRVRSSLPLTRAKTA